MRICALILAAGSGKRMNESTNKVFMNLSNSSETKPVLAFTIEAFESNENISEIIIVAKDSETGQIENIIDKFGYKKIKKIVNGGDTRQDSSYNGVYSCDIDTDYILIHDGARPLIDQETIDASIDDVKKNDICTVGVPVKDTIKTVDGSGFVTKTFDRKKLWKIQTPQIFKSEIIRKLQEKASEERIIATDDASLAENEGYKVKITKGSYKNIKITTKEDIELAKILIEKK